MNRIIIKRGKKSELFQLRMTHVEKNMVYEAAEKAGLPVCAWVRIIIFKALAENIDVMKDKDIAKMIKNVVSQEIKKKAYKKRPETREEFCARTGVPMSSFKISFDKRHK